MSELEQQDAVIIDYGVDALEQWQRALESRSLMPLYFPNGTIAAYFVLGELHVTQDVRSFDDRIKVKARLRAVRLIVPPAPTSIVDSDPGDES